MRIGVVSDTHNNRRSAARIVELLNAARVDRVVHTGDITQAKTLRWLAGLEAPLVGVFGNNDLERASLAAACAETGARFEDGPLRLDWGGRRLCVVHDPLDLEARHLAGVDVVLHGHTHSRTVEQRDGVLIFNPGECAGHEIGCNAVGVLELTRLAPRLLYF